MSMKFDMQEDKLMLLPNLVVLMYKMDEQRVFKGKQY